MQKIKLSVDDGAASDVRVAELARKYNIETVFYWPVEWHSLAYDNGYEPLSFDQAYKISLDFEIGSHTVTHRHLTKIGYLESIHEVVDSKDMLELLFATKVTKFCPPRGYTNEDITNLTLNHYKSQRLTRGKELVHIHPNSGANRNKDWRECITKDTKEVWGHSWEFDRFNLWEQLEEFLSAAS